MTDESTIDAGIGPNIIANMTAPIMWPLVPGSNGSGKCTIWAANTNAPMMPISANSSDVMNCFARWQMKPTPPAAIAIVPTATPGESNSFAMCMVNSLSKGLDGLSAHKLTRFVLPSQINCE